MTALLEVRHVSKEFNIGGLFSRRFVNAVSDVNFTLEKGKPEIFTIIGEFGSGKTTLARMILGLERPTERRDTVPGEIGGEHSPAARPAGIHETRPAGVPESIRGIQPAKEG